MTETVEKTARDAADRLAVAAHAATRALPKLTGTSFGQLLRATAAAVVVLVAGACRAVGDRERAERYLTAAELALRRFGREVAAAERRGWLTVETALRLLERSTTVVVALAAVEETLLGTRQAGAATERRVA